MGGQNSDTFLVSMVMTFYLIGHLREKVVLKVIAENGGATGY